MTSSPAMNCFLVPIYERSKVPSKVRTTFLSSFVYIFVTLVPYQGNNSYLRPFEGNNLKKTCIFPSWTQTFSVHKRSVSWLLKRAFEAWSPCSYLLRSLLTYFPKVCRLQLRHTNFMQYFLLHLLLVCLFLGSAAQAVQVMQQADRAHAAAQLFADGKDVFGRDLHCRTCHVLLSNPNARLLPLLKKMKAKEGRRVNGNDAASRRFDYTKCHRLYICSARPSFLI